MKIHVDMNEDRCYLSPYQKVFLCRWTLLYVELVCDSVVMHIVVRLLC